VIFLVFSWLRKKISKECDLFFLNIISKISFGTTRILRIFHGPIWTTTPRGTIHATAIYSSDKFPFFRPRGITPQTRKKFWRTPRGRPQRIHRRPRHYSTDTVGHRIGRRVPRAAGISAGNSFFGMPKISERSGIGIIPKFYPMVIVAADETFRTSR